MRFAKLAMRAICTRAAASGDAFMAIDDVVHDLGGPSDFDDVLDDLHSRGFITLHQGHKAISLTDRGWREKIDGSNAAPDVLADAVLAFACCALAASLRSMIMFGGLRRGRARSIRPSWGLTLSSTRTSKNSGSFGARRSGSSTSPRLLTEQRFLALRLCNLSWPESA